MIHIKSAIKRTPFGLAAALFLLSAVAVAIPTRQASAAALLERSLQLSSTAESTADPAADVVTGAGGFAAAAGSAANGNKVSHTYTFRAQTPGAIQAMVFQYCDTAFGYLEYAPDNDADACTDPAGFSATLAPSATVTFGNDLGTLAGAQTYTASATTATRLTIQNTSTPVTVTAGQYVRVVFTANASNYFTNPSSAYTDEGITETPSNQLNRTFFAHIETYADPADITAGTHVDEGTVTSAITNVIAINTRVQETLKFSVGSDDPTPADATCAPVTGSGNLTLGDAANNALSASQAYTAKSYFRLATNSSKGAQVLYGGETLRSSANDPIAAIGGTTAGDGTLDASTPGEEQFGLAIDTGDTDNVLTDLTTLTADYADAANDNYAFKTTSNTVPEVIASSPGVVACDTGVVEYVANISNETPAGLYSTKVAYVAVPTY